MQQMTRAQRNPFPQATHRGLPAYDGSIRVELSNNPIPYHIARCFPGKMDEDECSRFAMHSCRIACMSLDVVRGRTPPQVLQRAVTPPCLKRLETMSYLLENHMRTHQDLKKRLCYLPAIPSLVYGTLVSPETTEIVVSLNIGEICYWVNLVLKQVGSRWVCTLADLG